MIVLLIFLFSQLPFKGDLFSKKGVIKDKNKLKPNIKVHIILIIVIILFKIKKPQLK